MGKAQREKGKRWEREVAALFRPIFGDGVKRGWQARAGSDAPDVCGVGPFWIECKHHRRVNVQAALEQAREACPTRCLPLAICKDDRHPPMAAMLLEDFLDLIQEWKERAE